jgi:hypothetical protein
MAGEHCVPLAIISVLNGRGRLRRFKSGTDDEKLGGAACVRQEAQVANAAEAFWQHVEQEATDELVGFERHHLGLVVGTIIPPAEANVAVLAGEKSAVGNCNPMSVTAQIFQDLLRPAEGPLCVDVPFDVAQGPEMLREGRRLREMGEIAEQHQLRFVESRLQSLQEQPPIQSRQNPDGEEEVPSGMWLEFARRVSGELRLSDQAARSIG